MTQVDLFYDEIKFIPGDLYFLRLGVFLSWAGGFRSSGLYTYLTYVDASLCDGYGSNFALESQ